MAGERGRLAGEKVGKQVRKGCDASRKVREFGVISMRISTIIFLQAQLNANILPMSILLMNIQFTVIICTAILPVSMKPTLQRRRCYPHLPKEEISR